MPERQWRQTSASTPSSDSSVDKGRRKPHGFAVGQQSPASAPIAGSAAKTRSTPASSEEVGAR